MTQRLPGNRNRPSGYPRRWTDRGEHHSSNDEQFSLDVTASERATNAWQSDGALHIDPGVTPDMPILGSWEELAQMVQEDVGDAASPMGISESDPARSVEFWFDFSSPYAYFAAFEVGSVAARHGREVRWRPFLLGPALNATGMQPLTWTPLRGAYAQHDWKRMARRTGLPFQIPSRHPIITTKAARLVMWSEASRAIDTGELSRKFFTAYFGDGRDISDPDEIGRIIGELGLDASLLRTVAANEDYATALKKRTEEAIERGIFGSPFFIVDGEPFWGADRLPMVDSWLSTGGW